MHIFKVLEVDGISFFLLNLICLRGIREREVGTKEKKKEEAKVISKRTLAFHHQACNHVKSCPL